ncbi:MAG: GntR family transcriptional regulator [Nocardiopsaceae bacterium]|nr:GntR family transcriptional regulator [Nocardiopsaceae bacterium]
MAAKLARPDRQSLADLAYQTIAEAIYDRRLAPGERLSIDDLRQQLGMSATPVREALSRAAALELVHRDNHHGFTVAPGLTPVEMAQLFAVRRSLELEALAELTAPPGPPVHERLAELAASMAACEHGPHFSDITKFSRLDHSFHAELVAATGNRFLLRAWDGLHFHLRVHRVYAGEGVIDFTEAIGEHAAIVAAAGDRDLEALRAAVERHIDTAARRITRLSAEEADGGEAGATGKSQTTGGSAGGDGR